MQPKVKIALSVFSFVALVLTGLAAAEQVPKNKPASTESLISPNIISLSPKLVRRKNQFEKDDKAIRATDTLIIKDQPASSH
ncbi:MAG: hypothetical protein J0M29_19305 [Chitinophagales bacterium]|nr:hypothetical protein [Chitinophagales bacterium]